MIGKSIFSFNLSPKIRFGEYATESRLIVDEMVSNLGPRVLLITDRGITKLGLYDPIVSLMQRTTDAIFVFDEVEPDPSLATLRKSISIGTKHSVTGVIGFGGGSSMDVAKLVSLIIGSKENIDDIWGVDNAKGPRISLCLIPTTAGTGSEVTPVSIIKIDGEEKKGVVSSKLLPDLAILDPCLTLGLPAEITAATGVDAMVHAIEAFTSRNSNNNPISQFFAKEALTLLSRSIITAVNDGSQKTSRSEMLMGSMLAGIAFANSPVAGVHALAYPLGGIFCIPHGLSNSLVLPEILKFNLKVEKVARQYVELAKIVFPNLTQNGSPDEVAFKFADELKSLSKELGLPVRLRDLNIPKAACEKLAEDAMKQSRLLVNNPRQINKTDALNIYRSVW